MAEEITLIEKGDSSETHISFGRVIRKNIHGEVIDNRVVLMYVYNEDKQLDKTLRIVFNDHFSPKIVLHTANNDNAVEILDNDDLSMIVDYSPFWVFKNNSKDSYDCTIKMARYPWTDLRGNKGSKNYLTELEIYNAKPTLIESITKRRTNNDRRS